MVMVVLVVVVVVVLVVLHGVSVGGVASLVLVLLL
jgi:hypothetical protein